MIVEIIHFSMTSSLPANYVLDIGFTVLIKAVLPIYLINKILEKYLR